MRYKEYKKVDIPWLDEVPSHWEIQRIASVFNIRKEKNDPIKTEEVLSLSSKYGVTPYSEKKEKGGNKPKSDLTKYNLCYQGDILVNCMNVVAGEVGISNYFGDVCPVYYPLVTNKYNNKFYMEYLFRNYDFQRGMVGLGKGIMMNESENGNLTTVRMRISWDALKTLEIPVPPKEEQEQIARFLDWEINEIDRMIEIKKNEIENSNDIWESVLKDTLLNNKGNTKLKFMCDVISGKDVIEEVSYSEDAIPVFGSSNEPFKYTTKSMLNGEYIIFGRKGTIGKPYKLNGKFWIVDTAYAVKNKKNIKFDFLYFSLCALNWSAYTTQTALPSIVANEVIEEKIFCPSFEEQKIIAKKLNLILNKITNFKLRLQSQINNLEQLKQSLISDVVTGKIDVRNISIPEYEKASDIEDDTILEESFNEEV